MVSSESTVFLGAMVCGVEIEISALSRVKTYFSFHKSL